MKVECWLRIEAKKNRYCSDKTRPDYFEAGAVNVSKKKPAVTSANEVAVKLNIELPNALFLKPALEFDVRVPEQVSLSGEPITADVQNALADALSEQLGQEIRLNITAGKDLSEDAW